MEGVTLKTKKKLVKTQKKKTVDKKTSLAKTGKLYITRLYLMKKKTTHIYKREPFVGGGDGGVLFYVSR
jgi:hypothetical protein